MGRLRRRAVQLFLAVLAASALAACGSSDPGPIQAGPGDGVHSAHHHKHKKKHKHSGKHHHHHAKHTHSQRSGSGSGSGGSAGGSGGSGGGGGSSGSGGNGGGSGSGGSGGSGGGGGGSGSGGGSGGGGSGGGGGTHSSSPPRPPSTTTITVTPDSGLKDAQFVDVVGTNFTPDERLVIIECVDHGEQTGPSDCRVSGAKFLRANGSGHVERSIRVYEKINGQTCGSPTPCLVTVSPPSQASHTDEADQQIFFA